MAGAEIRVEGTNDRGGIQTFTTKTGAEGRYSQRLIPGIYKVRAWVPKAYNGVQGYWLGAEPTKGEWDTEFDTHKGGIARDFVWKIRGTKLGGDPSELRDTYGGFGTIAVGIEPFGDLDLLPKVPKGATAEVTFTPVGPLVDGTTGKVVVVRTRAYNDAALKEAGMFGRAGLGSYRDLPTGRYTVTARFLLPDGSAVPARIAASTPLWKGGARMDKPSTSVTIQPEPTSYAGAYANRALSEVGLFVVPNP